MKLMNMYMSTNQTQKAMDWIDRKVGDTQFSLINRSKSFTELTLFRAQLALDVQKDASVHLLWLKRTIQNCGSEATLKQICELRPDCVSEFEAQHLKSHPDAHLVLLDKAGRHDELNTLLSTKEILDKVLRKRERWERSSFNIVEYLSRNPTPRLSSTDAVVGYFLTELSGVLGTTTNDAYQRCVELLRALIAVSPQTGKAEVAKIRIKYKNRRKLIKMMDDAGFS